MVMMLWQHEKSILASLTKQTLKYDSQSVLQENERPIICVYHDKSTFYANAQQLSHWNVDTNTVLCQTSMGSAILVLDFIDVAGGFFEIGDIKHGQH